MAQFATPMLIGLLIQLSKNSSKLGDQKQLPSRSCAFALHRPAPQHSNVEIVLIWDMGTPRGATLPHHRTYGSRTRRFDWVKLGQDHEVEGDRANLTDLVRNPFPRLPALSFWRGTDRPTPASVRGWESGSCRGRSRPKSQVQDHLGLQGGYGSSAGSYGLEEAVRAHPQLLG
jgi:hypothetical protein